MNLRQAGQILGLGRKATSEEVRSAIKLKDPDLAKRYEAWRGGRRYAAHPDPTLGVEVMELLTKQGGIISQKDGDSDGCGDFDSDVNRTKESEHPSRAQGGRVIRSSATGGTAAGAEPAKAPPSQGSKRAFDVDSDMTAHDFSDFREKVSKLERVCAQLLKQSVDNEAHHAKLVAKCGLVDYCYHMRNTLQDLQFQDKFEANVLDTIGKAVQDTLH